MKIYFIIYDGMTTLDFIGVYDSLTRLKTMGFLFDMEYTVCSIQPEITSYEGLMIKPNLVKNDFSGADYIIIPGGHGIQNQLQNNEFLDWINSVPETCKIATVCSGSFVPGVLGKLKDKKATTHPALYEKLRPLIKELSEDRMVDEGNIITARGVSSSIDLGLYLVEKIAGKEIREKIQTQMDYLNYPL